MKEVDAEFHRRHYTEDFAAADAEYRRILRDPDWEKPDGYTWHHKSGTGHMELVKTEIHKSAVPHEGGAATLRNRMFRNGLVRINGVVVDGRDDARLGARARSTSNLARGLKVAGYALLFYNLANTEGIAQQEILEDTFDLLGFIAADAPLADAEMHWESPMPSPLPSPSEWEAKRRYTTHQLADEAYQLGVDMYFAGVSPRIVKELGFPQRDLGRPTRPGRFGNYPLSEYGLTTTWGPFGSRHDEIDPTTPWTVESQEKYNRLLELRDVIPNRLDAIILPGYADRQRSNQDAMQQLQKLPAPARSQLESTNRKMEDHVINELKRILGL